MNSITATLILSLFLVMTQQTLVNAHDAFKDPMAERYGLKSVSCKACHPNNKDKSIHNKFGIYYLNALKGKELTKKFKEAEAKGEEAVEAFEPEMVKHFIEAMKAVEKEKMTFEDMLKAGLINGTRPEKQKGQTTDGKKVDG